MPSAMPRDDIALRRADKIVLCWTHMSSYALLLGLSMLAA